MFAIADGRASSATNVAGLFYTGVDNTGGLLGGGTTDSHWSVTDATGGPTYQGAAYVVSGTYIDAGWVKNTTSAQWITAQGAKTSSSTSSATNAGGGYLPGNGTSGTNAASFIYQLAFTISGTGAVGSRVTNNVAITLTLAADDQASVYINPNFNSNGTIRTSASTLGGSLFAAWGNTGALTLQNFGGGANANFVIGTNYLVIQVDNTNSQTSVSGSNALNPSGLLVYQVGAVATIDGKPVPEVGAWIPVAAALGLFAWRSRRARTVLPAA